MTAVLVTIAAVLVTIAAIYFWLVVLGALGVARDARRDQARRRADIETTANRLRRAYGLEEEK